MGSDPLSDSSLVRQSYRQHKYDVCVISEFLYFFQMNGGNVEMRTVQSDSNNILSLISFHFLLNIM